MKSFFLMAGSNWRSRLIGAFGAFLGIALTAMVSALLASDDAHAAILLAAPLGASAVLMFAVPASPLSQPWPVIGGNMVSLAAGITCVHLFGQGALAAGLSVALAIVAMSALRCLHAPGGGTALLPVLAGPAGLAHGYGFVLAPVGINAALLVAIGWLFHRFSGHSYPHRAAPVAALPRLSAEDIDAALAESGETFDIDRDDLLALLDRAERQAEIRRAA